MYWKTIAYSIVVGGFLVLSGCITDVKKTYSASGEEAYTVNCSGSALVPNSWGMCYERAGQICETRGYEVLQRSDEKGSSLTVTQAGLIGGTNYPRMLMFKCK